MDTMLKCLYCKLPISPPTTAATKSQYIAHLRVAHKNERPTESQINNFAEEHEIHICPSCPFLQPYGTCNALNKHIHSRHLLHRTKTNIDFVTDTYRSANKETWQQTLTFLNHLNIEPPPFRSTIYRHIQATTKLELFAAYNNINKWILFASTPLDPNHPHVDPTNNTSDPFWKLHFIFEALLLFPPPHKQKTTTYSRLVQTRLQQFRKGNIIALYEEAFDLEKYQASPTTTPSFDNATSLSHSAQVAADADNYGVASQRIQSCMPTVTITDKIADEIANMYPPRIPFPSTASEKQYPQYTQQNARTTKNKPTNNNTQQYQINRDSTIRALRNIKKGTAPGPFTHSTDFLRAYALTKNKRQDNDNYMYLDTFIKLIEITTNNQLSPSTTLYFGSQYFTALYKDKTNLNKKRPISIGTAIRRINSAILLQHHRDDIAELCAPDGQYGIAIKGGLEFLVHKAQAQYHLFIDSPNQHMKPLLRALLLLDITNMFNELSRDACRLLLLSTPELHDLVPYFDQIYKEPNRCWYKTDKGTYRHFKQPEGFAQGCPLSGSFAAIVLSLLLKKINQELVLRQTDTNMPSPHTSSFIDDTNLFIPLQDIEWFIKRFDELGQPIGIKLNQDKTKLLTGPLTYISATQKTTLTHLATILKPENILTDGCELLGQPIGTRAYVSNHMQQKATKYRTTVSRITTRLLDRQTISSIYRYCAQPAIAHLIGTNILNTYNPNGTPPLGDPFQWTTPFLKAIETTDDFFLRFITDTNKDNLPTHASLIATIPAKGGGLGYRHPQRAALGAFTIPLARSIRYAITGLQIGPDTKSPLPADHRYAFETLTTQPPPTNNPWKHIETLTDLIDQTIRKNETQTLDVNITRHYTQRHLYQTLTANHLFQQIPLLTKDISLFLPSLLSPLTSIALHNLPRSEPSNRINNESFTLLVQRKLRLPILTNPTNHHKCICGTTFDKYGDHAFGCRRTSKTALHDAITKTLTIALRPLLTLTNRTNTAYDTVMEPTGLIPDAPTKRPADIMIRLSPPAKQTGKPTAKLQLLDITIPHPPSLPVPPGLNERLINPKTLAFFADRSHLTSMKEKYQGKTTSSATQTDTIATITERNYALIPITIDHLGRLGYTAHEFLGMPETHFPPTKPPWNKPSDLSRTNEFAYPAYTFAANSPQHLLHGVNAFWRELSTDTYGDTHHTTTPSTWFQQTVSLNISIAMAKHLSNARNRLEQTEKRITNDIHGIPYPFHTTTFHSCQRICT